MNRAAIADFLCPDNGYRGSMKRQGKPLKDHMKDNKSTIKDLQLKNREARIAASAPPKELYKLGQFKEIAARVYDEDNHNNENAENANFLTKGVSQVRREEIKRNSRQMRAELEKKMEEARNTADRPPTPSKGPTPKSNETAKLAPRSNADWVGRNKVKAITMMPPSAVDEEEPVKHAEFGTVPSYLQERKLEWEMEKVELQKRMPDPNCPKGMRLMPQDERVQTLEILLKSKDEAIKQLAKMPFIIETPSLRRKHGELEAKLREIESAIDLFSKQRGKVSIITYYSLLLFIRII